MPVQACVIQGIPAWHLGFESATRCIIWIFLCGKTLSASQRGRLKLFSSNLRSLNSQPGRRKGRHEIRGRPAPARCADGRAASICTTHFQALRPFHILNQRIEVLGLGCQVRHGSGSFAHSIGGLP